MLTPDRGAMEYTGYSGRNRDDALQAAAAANAQARGLVLRYAVVRVATEEAFSSRRAFVGPRTGSAPTRPQ